MTLIPLPAFSDNYIWMLHNGRDALVVDPGDAEPVRGALAQHGVRLSDILITHHHHDHVGGVDALREATGARVWGPAGEAMPEPLTRLRDGDAVSVLGLSFSVLDVPGHTAGHIAYFCADIDGAPLVFCGDTLFSGGCGRLFEGTPQQMLNSLDRLSALPAQTRVCCTHEYTLANLRFALAVEPDNLALQRHQLDCQALRERHLPTLPSQIGTERAINPFLRSREPSVVDAVRSQVPEADDEVAVFAALREWKNGFR